MYALIISIFFPVFRVKSLVVVTKDKAEINISRRRFEDEATKSGVDDEKAT